LLPPPRPRSAASRTAAGTCIPSAVKISGVGRNRSAAFGTRSTSSFSAAMKVMLAVIPGRSFRSGLATSMTAS
jgi:hypothetical protein